MRQSTKHQIGKTGSQTARERADALRARLPNVAADPIRAAIEANKRLKPAVRRTRRMPDVGPDRLDRPVEEKIAAQALHDHFFGTLLKTAPTTAAGALEFARYALAYNRFQGNTLDEKGLVRVLTLIAAVRTA